MTPDVYLDASGQTWHHVPGYGPVAWPIEQISEHARYVVAVHRPDRPAIAVRLVSGVLPCVVLPARCCKVCLTRWTCREARWAHWWLGSLDRGWRHTVEVAW